jgi:maleate cis-trans isomerase
VVAALRHLGAKRLAIVTPYPDWNNEKLLPCTHTIGWLLKFPSL